MKRILTFFIFILLAMGPGAAGAQTVVMDEGHVAFDYPDSWLVVSPQLCGVYAPLLEDAGLDADELARELEQTRTLSRAYNENYTQYLSVLIGEDELSQEIYEIENATDSQRATLRRRVEANSFWETTGLRTQDTEWQKEDGGSWLYAHYTVTRAGETVGRGLRYITVRNGLYVEMDWRISSGRFSGRDLNAFRARLADLVVTEQIAEPVLLRLLCLHRRSRNGAHSAFFGYACQGRRLHEPVSAGQGPHRNAGRKRRDADAGRGDGRDKGKIHADD